MIEANLRAGFTGTRRGCTGEQKRTLLAVISHLKPRELHHGCCIGADAEVHQICCYLRIPLVLHPPVVNDAISRQKRALLFYPPGTEVRVHQTYLVRDEELVEESDFLIACPNTMREERRSGTWFTVRQARKANKPVCIIWPNGKREHE